jgi:hypothetical protein
MALVVMNNILKELISQFVKNPDDIKIAYSIKELRPKAADFSDELFASFTAEGRWEIYARLLLWVGPATFRRILEQRITSEVDERCRTLVEFMLSEP